MKVRDGDLWACTACNCMYFHPNGQNQCYACGGTEFTEVELE